MIVNLKSTTDLSGLYVVYEGSTNLEKKGWYGLSHIMEHLMTKNFEHLFDNFDRDSIDWNAYTDNNLINFYFTGLESKLSKYRDKILKSLTTFNVTKEQFETERSIVLSEYEDYFNDQASSHNLNLRRKLFNDFDPIGLRKDLENLKFMDCLNFFELQYLNPTKIINVSKTFKLKETDIDLEFSDRKIIKTIEYSKHNVDLELGNDFKDKTSLIMLSPVINEDNSKVHFLNAMLSMGLRSPLYQEVREKRGLVYYIHCYQSRHNQQGLINIATLTNNKNVSQVLDSVEMVLKNPSKFLTQDRFKVVKEHYQVRKEKEEILRYENINSWINPPKWSVYDIIDNLKLKDVKDIYDKYYDFSTYYISNDKKEFK